MDHNHSMTPSSAGAELEERLERIEQGLGRVEALFSQLIEQKDAMLGMAADVLDGSDSPPASKEQRIRGVAKLAQELSEPQTTHALSSVLRVAPELQGGLGMGLDLLDEAIRDQPGLPERLASLFGLLNRIGNPETLKKINAGLDTLDQAPEFAGALFDLADQQIREWLERNQEQGSSVENIAANATQLIQWLSLDSTRHFLSKELSDSGSVQALAFLADSVRTATQRPPEAVGLFGGVRKLGRADSQYALGFVCDLVESLGNNLSRRPVSNRPSLEQEN